MAATPTPNTSSSFKTSAWDNPVLAPKAKPVTPVIATCKAELEKLDQDLECCDGRAYESIRKQRTKLIIKIMKLERREERKLRRKAKEADRVEHIEEELEVKAKTNPNIYDDLEF